MVRAIREADIEDYLVNRVRGRGGETRKAKWIGRRGAPDRVVFLPRGIVVWVELKRPGERPDPHQFREIEQLRSLGQEVVVCDSFAAVDDLMAEFVR